MRGSNKRQESFYENQTKLKSPPPTFKSVKEVESARQGAHGEGPRDLSHALSGIRTGSRFR